MFIGRMYSSTIIIQPNFVLNKEYYPNKCKKRTAFFDAVLILHKINVRFLLN